MIESFTNWMMNRLFDLFNIKFSLNILYVNLTFNKIYPEFNGNSTLFFA